MRLKACKGYSAMISRYGAHAHDHWEIVLESIGNATTVAADQSFLLSPGDLLVIPPHTLHQGSGNQEFCDFSLLVSNLDFPQEPFVVQDADGMIGQWMEMLLRLYTEREPYYEQIIDCLINSVFYAIKKKTRMHRGIPLPSHSSSAFTKIFPIPTFRLGMRLPPRGIIPIISVGASSRSFMSLPWNI